MRLTQRATAWSLALACLLAPSLAAGQAIEILGSKVPVQAIGFGSLGGSVTMVTPANPMPMICVSGCSATGAGTATATAPTRTEGQSYGLSFDLNGGLRVSGGGGGGGGGTEFAEDAVHASGALGTFALVVRKDAAASLAGTDGDYSGLIVDAFGRLHVNPGTVPVTGTFWQAIQPVSLASQPLPSGAATSALQTPANASLAAIDADLGSSAEAAYTGTGASVSSYLRAIADSAIQTGAAEVTGVARAATASSAAEACRVFKASAGTLYGASGYIGAAGFIMVFDAASAPADGAVTPKAWAHATAAGSWSISYGITPLALASGITICASSTGPLSKTAYSTNTVFSGQFQ